MGSGASTMVAAGKPAACNLGGDPTSTSLLFVCDSHNTCALASSSSALREKKELLSRSARTRKVLGSVGLKGPG